MEKEIKIAFRSKYFSVYEAFKKEAESRGFVYLSGFSNFTESNASRLDCLYFSDKYPAFEGLNSFSFSNNDSSTQLINLDSSFDEAIKSLDKWGLTILTKKDIAEKFGVDVNKLKIVD